MAMADNISDGQLDFLLEVLQAIADSNGDHQVVDKLLEANIDKLNQSLAEKFRDWATSKLAEAETDQATSLSANIFEFSKIVAKFPALLNQKMV